MQYGWVFQDVNVKSAEHRLCVLQCLLDILGVRDLIPARADGLTTTVMTVINGLERVDLAEDAHNHRPYQVKPLTQTSLDDALDILVCLVD